MAIVLVVLALAVGIGEVKLDDPISMYLPEGLQRQVAVPAN